MPVVKVFEDALLDVIDKSELDDSIIPDHKVYEYIAASYSMLGSHDRSWQILAFCRDAEVEYDYYCFEYCACQASNIFIFLRKIDLLYARPILMT